MDLTNNLYYLGAFLLVGVGLYAVLGKRNLIKVIMGLGLIDSGINLLLISIGYIRAHTAPIITSSRSDVSLMVDPIPQALVLTAIVIGLSVLALALALAIKIFATHKTLNLNKIKGLKW